MYGKSTTTRVIGGERLVIPGELNAKTWTDYKGALADKRYFFRCRHEDSFLYIEDFYFWTSQQRHYGLENEYLFSLRSGLADVYGKELQTPGSHGVTCILQHFLKTLESEGKDLGTGVWEAKRQNRATFWREILQSPGLTLARESSSRVPYSVPIGLPGVDYHKATMPDSLRHFCGTRPAKKPPVRKIFLNLNDPPLDLNVPYEEQNQEPAQGSPDVVIALPRGKVIKTEMPETPREINLESFGLIQLAMTGDETDGDTETICDDDSEREDEIVESILEETPIQKTRPRGRKPQAKKSSSRSKKARDIVSTDKAPNGIKVTLKCDLPEQKQSLKRKVESYEPTVKGYVVGDFFICRPARVRKPRAIFDPTPEKMWQRKKAKHF